MAAQYKQRYDFDKIAHEVADSMINVEFQAAIKMEMDR
jgi:hypothetical protein